MLVKKYLAFLLIFLLVIGSSISISAESYLSKSELLKIGGGSVGIAVIGFLSENSVTESRNSFIKGPIFFDRYFQKQIGGDLSINCRKTNFLDNTQGAILTPAIGITFLLAADYGFYQKNQKKQLFQDMYLFSTGLMATAGVTSLFKGVIARERPYYYEQDLKIKPFEREDKLSFFSGHVSLAFYSMHYLNKRLSTIMSEKNISPKWQLFKSFSCYGWASFVAFSRIQASKHYATDVIAGAGVGILVSELFFRFGEHKLSNISLRSSGSNLTLSYSF